MRAALLALDRVDVAPGPSGAAEHVVDRGRDLVFSRSAAARSDGTVSPGGVLDVESAGSEGRASGLVERSAGPAAGFDT